LVPPSVLTGTILPDFAQIAETPKSAAEGLEA
jgi:hypothetical protein